MRIRLFFLCMLVFFSGCVREVTGHVFKEPTQESLDRALSTYVEIAYKQMDEKKYDVALKSLEKAFNIDKNSPKALTGLAVLYQLQGEGEKSEKIFKQVIHHHSEHTDAYLRYGNFLFQEVRYEEACKNFLKASEDDFYPKRAISFYNLGTCYRELQQWDKAEAAFNRFVGLQPYNTDALLELAELKFKKQDYPESKKYYDNYVAAVRKNGTMLSARVLWLGIQLERIYSNKDREASLGLQLKNNYPYSSEYLEYQNSQK